MRGAEVVAREHEGEHDGRDGHEVGQHDVQRARHPGRLVGEDQGADEHERELGELRRLELQRADRQPVAVAVDHLAERDDGGEQARSTG